MKHVKALATGLIFLDTLDALTDALIPDTRFRAMSTLLRIAGCKHGGNAPGSVPVTQAEFAAITNLLRQTCGQLLHGLQRDGLTRPCNRQIEVLAPARLRSMVTDR